MKIRFVIQIPFIDTYTRQQGWTDLNPGRMPEFRTLDKAQAWAAREDAEWKETGHAGFAHRIVKHTTTFEIVAV